MGLGKTVEMLGCILANPHPSKEDAFLSPALATGGSEKRERRRQCGEEDLSPRPPSTQKSKTGILLPLNYTAGGICVKPSNQSHFERDSAAPPRSILYKSLGFLCSYIPEIIFFYFFLLSSSSGFFLCLAFLLLLLLLGSPRESSVLHSAFI